MVQRRVTGAQGETEAVGGEREGLSERDPVSPYLNEAGQEVKEGGVESQ